MKRVFALLGLALALTGCGGVKANLYRVSGQVGPRAAPLRVDAGSARALRGNEGALSAGGLIVKYASEASRRALAQSLRGEPSGPGAAERLALLRPGDEAATLRSLARDPRVEYAVPNVVLRALGTAPDKTALDKTAPNEEAPGSPVVPPDEYAPLQWMFPLTDYGAAWRDMADHPGAYARPVTVAVLDTGVRFDHPDLRGALYESGEGALDLVAPPAQSGAPGDAYGLDDDPTDPAYPGRTEGSHGTHVVGLIAARSGSFARPCPSCSDSGVVGAAYAAPVKVLPVRVLDAYGAGDLWTIAQGIRYAAGLSVTVAGKTYANPHPAQVINLSLGAPITAAQARPLCDAVAAASGQGALVVAAAGNAGDAEPYYPAACEGAVPVAAVTLADGAPRQAYYSNAYDKILLSAPGGDSNQFVNGATLGGQRVPDAVWSTSWNYPDNTPKYEGMMGTSQAAPQVSALAALLFCKGNLDGQSASTASAVLARLEQTATDLGPAGRDRVYGFGMIDAASALGAASVTLPAKVFARRAGGANPVNVALPLDELGRFGAFLPGGQYVLQVREDVNGNGIYGEAGEPRADEAFTLGQDAPQKDFGVLTPK